MLMHGVGFFTPTRLQPEATRRFAAPFGSVHAAAQLVTERTDNARLEGLGCDGNRQCAPCAAKAQARANVMARLDGFGAVDVDGTQFGTDEDEEAAALGMGYLEEALPRLQALRARVDAIGPPRMFEGWLSSSYYSQFEPILNETIAILQARPDGLSQETRDALAKAADSVSNAVLRVQNAPDADAYMAVAAALTMNYTVLFAILVRNRESVARINADIAAGVKENAAAAKAALEAALKKGRDTLAGALDMGKYIMVGLAALLAFALYGRVRG